MKEKNIMKCTSFGTKLTLAFLLTVAVGAGGNAQQELPQLTTQDNAQVVSVDLFEDPTLWDSIISHDNGITIHQRFEGGPRAKTPISGIGAGPLQDENVLGVKTEFIRRGFTQIVVAPLRPIAIPGVVREVSVWVAGRELPHELYLLVRDIDGEDRKVFVDRLNHRGWKEMRAIIPPYEITPEGYRLGIKQYNSRVPLNSGLELVALIIEPLFTEAYGSYYVYFDDMRATTDLSVFGLQDADDIVDAW